MKNIDDAPPMKFLKSINVYYFIDNFIYNYSYDISIYLIYKI